MLFERDMSELDKRVSLQRPTKASNGMGGFVVTWSTVDTIWARVLPTSAKEARQSEKETMEISHTITIRFRRDVRGSWRIKMKNRYFAIVGIVNPEEANEWLDINAREAKL
jgi:SPP1 family predicted phage head-tail adaptor